MSVVEKKVLKEEWVGHEYTQMKAKAQEGIVASKMMGLREACHQTTDATVARAFGSFLAAEEQLALLKGRTHEE